MHALLLPKTTEHRPRNKSFRSNNRKACMIRLYKLLSFRLSWWRGSSHRPLTWHWPKGWAYSAAMIDHSQSVSSSVQKPRTPSIAFAAIRHCCPCWHKMIARAWQVSHAIPGWCVTGEDWLLQRRESKDDELASQPTMSLGRRMIQWMEWRWPRGVPILYPIPRSVGERDRLHYWPAFVSVFISSNQSWQHLLADHCSDHV